MIRSRDYLLDGKSPVVTVSLLLWLWRLFTPKESNIPLNFAIPFITKDGKK